MFACDAVFASPALADLQEEVGVLKTQAEAAAAAAAARLDATATSAPPALDRNLSASPTSSTNDSHFATPRRSGSPASTASSTPPAVALALAKPAPTAARAIGSPSPAPSASSAASSSAAWRVRKPSLAKPSSPGGGVGGLPRAGSTLSRSVRGSNLASAVHTTGATGMTPKAVKERKSDGMVKEMREATLRMRQLTSRLESRRDLVMAGSGIPRASMSPGGIQRSYTTKRGAGPSRLAYEGAPAHSRNGSEAKAEGASRPASRAALRQSVGGKPSFAPSGVPRPVSRQGTNALGVSTMSSRPATPSLPSGRAPTPSHGRLPLAAAGGRALATSARPRAGSLALGASTHARTSSIGRGGSDTLAQSVRRPLSRPVSRQGTREGDERAKYGVLGAGAGASAGAGAGAGRMAPPPMPSPGTQAGALRRASLHVKSRLPESTRPGSALGRSIRRPSGTGGPD